MRKAILVLALIIGVCFLAGCAQKEGTGTLNMQITDAPADLDIEKAVVTISNVQVHYAGTEPEETNETENTTESESGWFDVVSESKTYDLVAIKDVKEFLGSAELKAGKYTQVRLSIDKAVVTIDGTEYDLTVPSEKLKLTKGFNIVANQTTTLTLDFDAQESIVSAGDKYNLKPTIKIIQE